MEQEYLNQPIRSLQTMLREISFLCPEVPRLVPDGVFGPETEGAVSVFQRLQGLPETGRVDNDTWDAVVVVFYQVLPYTAPPKPLNGFPRRPFAVPSGRRCPHMYPVQAMFQALRWTFPEVEPGPVDGSHTGASVRNTVWLQRRSGLPQTGVVDQPTWDRLSRLYEVFVTRGEAELFCVQGSGLPPGLSQGTRGFPWEPDGGR